jgi:hypothetical protein
MVESDVSHGCEMRRRSKVGPRSVCLVCDEAKMPLLPRLNDVSDIDLHKTQYRTEPALLVLRLPNHQNRHDIYIELANNCEERHFFASTPHQHCAILSGFELQTIVRYKINLINH